MQSDGTRTDDFHEVEVIDGEVVEHLEVQIAPCEPERLPARAAQPGVQTAVAAATGFVAGAATLALLRRYAQSRLDRATHPGGLPGGALAAGRGRTYIVHVQPLRPYVE